MREKLVFGFVVAGCLIFSANCFASFSDSELLGQAKKKDCSFARALEQEGSYGAASKRHFQANVEVHLKKLARQQSLARDFVDGAEKSLFQKNSYFLEMTQNAIKELIKFNENGVSSQEFLEFKAGIDVHYLPYLRKNLKRIAKPLFKDGEDFFCLIEDSTDIASKNPVLDYTLVCSSKEDKEKAFALDFEISDGAFGLNPANATAKIPTNNVVSFDHLNKRSEVTLNGILQPKSMSWSPKASKPQGSWEKVGNDFLSETDAKINVTDWTLAELTSVSFPVLEEPADINSLAQQITEMTFASLVKKRQNLSSYSVVQSEGCELPGKVSDESSADYKSKEFETLRKYFEACPLNCAEPTLEDLPEIGIGGGFW